MKYTILGLPFFFIFVGFILLVLSAFLKNKVDNMKLRCNKKVMAKITKREISKINDSTLCYYWYGYSINGKEYNTRTKYMISALKYKVGDNVEILYNPNDLNDIYNPNDMGKQSHKLVFGIGIGFLLMGIVSSIILYTTDILKSNNDITNDKTDDSIEKVTINQIKSFLISDNLITKHNVVASNMPDGYVFLEDGRFAYYDQDFYRQFTESEENRLISFIGTWHLDNNKLTLNIEKEEYAVGGEINPGPPYPMLKEYTKEVRNTDKIIEYTINKIDNTTEYMPFILLTQDTNEIKWYSLPGVYEYVKTIKELAQNGYNNTNKNE